MDSKAAESVDSERILCFPIYDRQEKETLYRRHGRAELTSDCKQLVTNLFGVLARFVNESSEQPHASTLLPEFAEICTEFLPEIGIASRYELLQSASRYIRIRENRVLDEPGG